MIKRFLGSAVVTVVTLISGTPPVLADSVAKTPQFLYLLRVEPRLHDPKAWTDADNKAVAQHFLRLQKATETGQVILAGRTSETPDKTFGLVIFEAENAEAAKAFMEGDPAVAAKVMSATLHPYSIALQRKP